jgi:hypothetical protein
MKKVVLALTVTVLVLVGTAIVHAKNQRAILEAYKQACTEALVKIHKTSKSDVSDEVLSEHCEIKAHAYLRKKNK